MTNKYVAFLRGVNLGRRTVKKHELIEVFARMGFGRVETFLASGNVLFESQDTPDAEKIESALGAFFGFDIAVVLRSMEELNQFAQNQPFAAYEGTSDTKLYVTMAAAPIGGRLEGVSGVAGDFDLVDICERDYFTAAFRQEDGRFGSGLDQLEKRFKGLSITTRNWNTIMRILKKTSA